MVKFEKNFLDELMEKDFDQYNYIDAIVILGEVISNAKNNNLNTNRAKTESSKFKNIIGEASDGYEHKYAELLECVHCMNFIKKEMRKNIPNAEEYFNNALKWLENNKDSCVDKTCNYYYSRSLFGKMFEMNNEKFKYINEQRDKKYDRIELIVPKGMKEKIQKRAKELGLYNKRQQPNVAKYITQLVEKDLDE